MHPTHFSIKLRGKGFTYNARTDGYQGQFNGKDEDVYIHTNHNLVDLAYAAFPNTTEREIKTEFKAINLPVYKQKELSKQIMAELESMGFQQDHNAEPDSEKTFLIWSTLIGGG